MIKRILSVLVIAMVVLLVAGCQNKPKSSTVSDTGKPVINSLAPDFTTKNILTGQDIHLADYKGKVTLVNLWATWCPPCRGEIPSMNNFYQHYNGKVAIIAISVDESSDNAVLNFANSYNMRFDVAHDTGMIAKTYGTGSIPTTYVINKKGEVVYRIVGSIDWESADIYNYFDRLVAE